MKSIFFALLLSCFILSSQQLQEQTAPTFSFLLDNSPSSTFLVGADNITLSLITSFGADYTALVGPNCTTCGSLANKLATSATQGYLEATGEKVEVLNVTKVYGKIMYIHGRWGVETVATSSEANSVIYGKANRHKVFIIEKIEAEDKGVNKTVTAEVSGFIGLNKRQDAKSSTQSYGEYLKSRNLIAQNSLAIENQKGFIFKTNVTYGVFNKTSV